MLRSAQTGMLPSGVLRFVVLQRSRCRIRVLSTRMHDHSPIAAFGAGELPWPRRDPPTCALASYYLASYYLPSAQTTTTHLLYIPWNP